MLEESGSPDVLLLDFGALQECLANPLDILLHCCWSSRSFWILLQTSFILKFFCQLQICFAVGDFLENFFTNICCTVLFECVQAFSNTQNAFSLLVNTISTHCFERGTPEKINISNIKHKIVTFYTCCVNIKPFKQELAKLLDCKMMPIFLKHPVYLFFLQV